MAKKIFVCCPGDTVTGGPELLHQLVDSLREIEKEAYICYFPFNKKFIRPKPYQHYNTPQSTPVDSENSTIILPEVATNLSRHFKKSNIAIWWLSVDNYLNKDGENKPLDFLRNLYGHTRGKLPIGRMKNFLHFAQSAYSKDFLEKKGIIPQTLTDYLGNEHLKNKESKYKRENIIAYNPTKGIQKTHLIIKNNPGIQFIPIKNMSTTEVRQLLSKAKIYIDFGHHPGKDRLPREAAIAGCCIITGRKGSAANAHDIPIPNHYKLDEHSQSFLETFREITNKIFSDFDNCSSELDRYREKISDEPRLFKEQVKKIFNNL